MLRRADRDIVYLKYSITSEISILFFFFLTLFINSRIFTYLFLHGFFFQNKR